MKIGGRGGEVPEQPIENATVLDFRLLGRGRDVFSWAPESLGIEREITTGKIR
jgi:hypothetical protein